MNRKIWLPLALACGIFFLLLYGAFEKELPAQSFQEEKEEIVSIVEAFGSKLQMVSLSAPPDLLRKSIQENYSPLIFPDLLRRWLEGTGEVPGRLSSSPWPDRIEIFSVEKKFPDAYEVLGKIVEISSTEKEGGAAATRPITLMVKKLEGKWRIAEVALAPYEAADPITYRNTEYGFTFTLPKSWQGYTTITDKWNGFTDADSPVSGPLLLIRHPDWTAEKPRQDIPIMIFTKELWDSLQEGKLRIGAAPIPPRELGRNSKYVFALPARYNYAFPAGYQEVEAILERAPLKPCEI